MSKGAIVLLSALIFHSTTAQAQNPPQSAARPRWGLAAAVGAGAGAGKISCAVCAGRGGIGPAGFGRIGGMYRSDLTVSLQVDWWTKDTRAAGGDASLSLWTTNATLQWYPSDAGRWFVTSGLGVGFVEPDIKMTVFDPSTSSRGLSYQAGVGYDIPRWEHLSLSPYASIFGVSGAKITNTQNSLGGAVGHIGLGLSWR